MPVKCINVDCNSITTNEEDIFRDVEKQGLVPEAREVVQNLVDSLRIEQRNVAATKEEKQYVLLQGQLLVLGDTRTGKTSTVKALTGEEFKGDENETKGVEFKYVNQEWKSIDLQDMQFGNFDRFAETVEIEEASWPPIYDQQRHTIGNDYKSLVGNLFRFVIHVYTYNIILDILKDSVWFAIYLVISRLIIWNSSLSLFSKTILVEVLFYVLLFRRLFQYPAADRRKLLGSFMVFFLLRHFGYLSTTTTNLYTGNCQMESPCDCSNETIAVRELLNKCDQYFSYFVLFCLIICICLLFTNSIAFSNPLVQLQLILIKCSLISREDIPLLLGILVRLIVIVRFGIIGPFCLIDYCTPLFNGFFVFTLHIFLLYQQKIPLKWYTGAGLALELAIIFQMCFIDLNSKVQFILLNVLLLCVGAALHIYGRWLEVNDVSKDSITEYFGHGRDPTIYSIAIMKFSPNMQKLKANFCKLKIKILDFAGDEEYYAYHQIFLNSNSIYVIVFNIQEYTKDNFKDIKSKVRRLRFWLESIHSHVSQSTPIFLVGTHRADIEMDTLREINSCIRKAVWHMPFNESIVINKKDDLLFFHVENSRGLADDGVLTLRDKIRSVAEDEFKNVIGQEIPLSWIKMQDAIIRYQKRRRTPVCLTVKDLKEVFDHSYLKWSEEMLKYFHKKGFIIYEDKNKNDELFAEAMAEKNEGLSKWVLLKPDALVQLVILLISQPEELTKTRGLRRHWTLLKKSGMLTKNLLQFILSRTTGHQSTEESSLIAFLEEYDLIYPLKDPFRDMEHLPDIKQITHLVPSLLPAASESQTLWLESSEDVKFYIFFDSYVPEAFFFRLLSRSCKASYDEMESYEPQIYRDCGVFLFSQQIYRLQLMKDEGLIEVTMTKSSGFWKPFDILRAIAIRVEDIRNRDFHNLFFHCGPECSSPICPGSCTDSTSLLTDQPRRHVYNVYPACKQKGPKCFKDFFKCQNVFRGEDAEIWKPPPINRGPIEGLRQMEHSQGW